MLGSPNLVGHQPAKLVGFIPLRVQIPPPAMVGMKIVKLKDILDKRKISELSPTILIAKKLGLKYLVEEDGLITGPAIGLSILIDKLTKISPIRTMLDLCSGSGALCKIAKKNGVQKIVCVDKNVKAIKRNIGRVRGVEIVKADVLNYKIKEFFDLIVLDAPREVLAKLVNKFEYFISNSNIFAIWHGSLEEFEWNEEIREKLRKVSKVLYSFSIYGEEISACSSTKNGMKWLKKLYKWW